MKSKNLVYTWASSLDESFDINTTVQSDGSMLESTYLSAGQHFITLNVEDTTGKHRQTVLQLPLVDQTMHQLVTLPSQTLALQVQKGFDYFYRCC